MKHNTRVIIGSAFISVAAGQIGFIINPNSPYQTFIFVTLTLAIGLNILLQK